MKGIVADIQRFSVHDGPGVRTTIFLKGCPLRCRWCHNPETQLPKPQIQLTHMRCLGCGACVAACPNGAHQLRAEGHRYESDRCTHCLACAQACMPGAIEICGRLWETEEVLQMALRDRACYGSSGGMTLSGGEPMLQAEFAQELLEGAERLDLSCYVETCGYFAPEQVEGLMHHAQGVYWDIKDTDAIRHKAYTGVGLDRIWRNLERAAAIAPQKITLRCIIVGGVNDQEAHIQAVAALRERLRIPRVELIPFHPYGSSKARALGRTAEMNEQAIPDSGWMEQMRQKWLDSYTNSRKCAML